MFDMSEWLYRVKTLPPIPRMIVLSLIGLFVVGIIVWSFSDVLFPPQSGHPATRSQATVVRPATGVSPLLFGTNLGLYNSKDQVLTSAATRSLLQQIHVQAVRIPMRTTLSETTEIQAAQAVKAMGAVPVIDLPGPTDTNALTDDTRIISDMNGIFGKSTVYYEYGNEEDLAGVSAESYTASWNAVVPLLKELAPHANFVGPATYQYDQAYITAFLKGARPQPDEISWHEYACVANDTQDSCIAHINDWSTHIANARTAMISAVGKALPIMITEWNYAPDATPNDGKSNDSTFLSTWTQKAMQTLAANHVFGSMQYFCTSTTVPLVDSHNNLAVQGIAFQAAYEHTITAPQSTSYADQTAPTTSSSDAPQILQSTATATTNPTPSPQPTVTNTASPTTSPQATATNTTSSLSQPATTNNTAATSQTSQSTTTTAPTTPGTSTPTLTPQSLYQYVTSMQPTYTTTLAAQDGGQWEEGTFEGGGGCEFTNGAYNISVPQRNTVGVCDAGGTSVVNFALQVQVKIHSGDGAGIIFRDNGTNFYHFGIAANGTFSLNNQAKVIASGSNAAIRAGLNQANTLMVIVQDQRIDLYANKQLLANVNDSASNSGAIGLFAVDVTLPTQATFSNLKVWPIVSSNVTTMLTPVALLTATPASTSTSGSTNTSTTSTSSSSSSSSTTSSDATPTPTVDATSTAAPIPTSTPALTPTPTPTVVPTPTPTSTPTPTPQSLYTTVTSERPAYTTSLARQDAGQWQTGTVAGGGCSFINGAYNISMSLRGTVAVCDANATSVANFALQVQMTMVSGDGGGIVFRDNGHGFYRFRVGSDGTFDLVNQTNGLVSGFSAAIKKGLNQVNTLTVIAQGQQIDLYVNGQFLTSVNDSASISGKVGLFAVDFSNPTRAAFSNLKVWSLQ
jgi:hypothetical protein